METEKPLESRTFCEGICNAERQLAIRNSPSTIKPTTHSDRSQAQPSGNSTNSQRKSLKSLSATRARLRPSLVPFCNQVLPVKSSS
ncbi:hypothetical protein BaRGS_00030545 [Batillaria attramentaria]|uniref:Uncharacterized protein n=1 Tax=Batillaria attramentaria TaxID=370345 RepID=A0ABD0JU17_9CAEN